MSVSRVACARSFFAAEVDETISRTFFFRRYFVPRILHFSKCSWFFSHLGRLLYKTFSFEVASGAFLAFKLVFTPQREEIEPALLGMSLTTLGEVPRPVFRFRVAVAIILDY